MPKFKLQATYNEEPTLTEMIAKLGDEGIVVFFSFIEDESSTVEASITDNYVETNHSMQDHIAIKPKIYRLRGCIGEVVYKGSTKWMDAISEKVNNNPILKKTVSALTPIAAVSPVISSYTQSAKNIVNQIESSYNRYKQLIEENFIQSRRPKLTNKMQETVVAYLNRLLELRQEVTLKGLKFQTVLNADAPNKAIERKYYLQSVSAHQGNNDFITDVEVTIKEFRIATTKTTKLDKNKLGGFSTYNVMSKEEANNGQAKGEKVEKSTKELTKKVTLKDKAKEALSGHPVLYNVTKKVYNEIIDQFSKGIFNPNKYKG